MVYLVCVRVPAAVVRRPLSAMIDSPRGLVLLGYGPDTRAIEISVP